MTIRAIPTVKAEAETDVRDVIDQMNKEIAEYGAEAIVIGVLHPNREASISFACGDKWLECVGMLDVIKQRLLD